MLIGGAEPVTDLNEDPEVAIPAAATDAPVNEKGDEPLQHHQEEIEESHPDSSEEGLTLFQKLGAVAVIIVVCVVFVQSTSGARSPAAQGYEKSLA